MNKLIGDLARSPGARRQAELEARPKALGYKRTTVWIQQASYDAGVTAAQRGSHTIRDFPQDVTDRQSWVAGYATEIARHEEALRMARSKNKPPEAVCGGSQLPTPLADSY